MRTILPPTPRIAGKISIHGFNADKANALYYGTIDVYNPEAMLLGRYYSVTTQNETHTAELVQLSAFDFDKLTDSLALMCEGVSKSTLRQQLIQQHGPDVVKGKLAMYVFRNWDKYVYINYFSQPFIQTPQEQ